MMYIGVDPGKHGAIALLRRDGKYHHVFDMPMDSMTDWYNPQTIRDIFSIAEAMVCLEKVWRFPKLCLGYGILWSQAKTLYSVKEVIEVAPITWQKEFKIKKADKEQSMKIARQLFPQAATRLTLKGHHNRAEALLIAEYGRKHCHI